MNRLKFLREEKQLKQADIAEILHLEIAAISKFETGRVPLKDDYIKKLAEYFDVSADYLLGISDERNPLPADTDFRIGLSRTEEGSLSEEEKQQIRDFAKYVISKRGGK